MRDAITGGGAGVTWTVAGAELWPSGLVTVTVLGPGAAVGAALPEKRIRVADCTTTPAIVRSLEELVTVAPVWKPEPVRVNVTPLSPGRMELGVIDAITGGGAGVTWTVAGGELWPSGLVTVTVLGPGAAVGAALPEKRIRVADAPRRRRL